MKKIIALVLAFSFTALSDHEHAFIDAFNNGELAQAVLLCSEIDPTKPIIYKAVRLTVFEFLITGLAQIKDAQNLKMRSLLLIKLIEKDHDVNLMLDTCFKTPYTLFSDELSAVKDDESSTILQPASLAFLKASQKSFLAATSSGELTILQTLTAQVFKLSAENDDRDRVLTLLEGRMNEATRKERKRSWSQQ